MTAAPPVRILLVEDNHGDIRLVRLALAECSFPHTLEVAVDAEQALQVLRKAPSPNLIVLDLNLPGLDGGAFLDKFLNDPDLCDLPVVILSSSQSPRDRARAEQLRHGLYIPKPSDLDAFLEIGPRIIEFWKDVQALSSE